jgi:chloride channel protein, CIC family
LNEDKMAERTPLARLSTARNFLSAKFWSSETVVMMTFAIVVGIGAGLGTIVFVEMISFFTNLLFGGGASVLGFLGPAYVIVLPIVGGLLVGPIIHFVAPEAKGHGVPEVMTAIATRGGRIRPVVVLAKAIGSAITIGAGGSVGREGPIVQIGSALGSTIGQFFKLNERRVINLVASGAAAGIAATFNAPIAGVMFAQEVILGEFGAQAFSTVVVSAVTASVVSRAALGDSPAFQVPAYALRNPWELVLYLGLGVVAAFAAIAFVKTLYRFEDFFDSWQFPAYLKPAVGGLALGVLGFFLPQVFGTGFDTIESALAGNMPLILLVVLIFGKTLATSLTLGSGASGGVFAPALFIGAVLGGAYGEIAHSLLPGVAASSGAYAMVGMAAVFAGAARAPITAIIIMFEMTQDYRIILPLMFATVVSTALASWLEPESIYTLKLKLRGIDVRSRRDTNLMRTILVEEAMTPADEIPVVTPDTALTEIAKLFQETSHHGFIVIDENSELYGVVTLSDLERALEAGKTDGLVRDICSSNLVTAFPDETLDDALRHFGALDVGRIPVVSRSQPKRLLGVVRRSDIVRAYSHVLVDKHQRDHHVARLRLEAAADSEFAEIDLNVNDVAAGRRLKEISIPNDCIIVSIRRGERAIVPRGNTQLLAGDRIIAFAANESIASLQRALHQGEAAPDDRSEIAEESRP